MKEALETLAFYMAKHNENSCKLPSRSCFGCLSRSQIIRQQQHSDLDHICGRKPSEIGFRRLTFRINGFFYSLKTPPDLVNLFQKPKQPRD